MKKRLAIIVSAVLVMLCAMAMCVSASADELPDSSDKIGTMTVVYLRDGGTGDGHDYANAVGTLDDAYMMLDLSKDCTIVVCDVYTHISPRFTIGTPYTGSVTVTSCYGGYDYRTIGAVFEFDPFRYVCWGETIFEYIDFHTPGTNMLVVGQHNPVTVGEGVNISGDQMTGGNIAKSFCILGGYQNNQDDPPDEDDCDTNITVLSGKHLYIVPFSREIVGTYEGTAHIKIGGNADVGVLHGSAAYHDGVFVGNVEYEITGNAHIKNFYGVTQDTNAKSYIFNWKSGIIDNFYWVCPNTASKQLIVEGKTTLNASPAVKALANYAEIAGKFDLLGDVAADAAYEPVPSPDNKTPGDDILKAPVNSQTPLPPELEGDGDDVTTGPVGTDKVPEDSNNSSKDTQKETKPAFTRGGKDDDDDDDKDKDKDDEDTVDETGEFPIWIIAAIAGVVVVAVIVVVVIVSKKNKE